MVETLIFRFQPNPEFKFSLPLPVDWNGELSKALQHQINNNHFNLRRLEKECSQHLNQVSTIVNLNQQYMIQPYLSSWSQCQTFLARVPNYLEVERLDIDAIYQTNFNVELHAVVILHQGEYYGHIYAWISPMDPEYCLFIGIRNRIESIFLQNTEWELKGVSKYLIEGVKQFGRSQGCQKIVVVYPEPIMKKILPRMGFQPEPIPISYFGQSVQTFSTQADLVCDSCLSFEL